MEQLNSLAIWAQILGLPIAVITIFISVWIAWQDKQKRSLACEFQSLEFPLEIKADDTIENDIKIHFRGQLVKNLFVIRVRLKNIGNQPIRKDHIVEPVKFVFDQETILLIPPRILDKKPENLSISWEGSSAIASNQKNGDVSLSIKNKKAPILLLNFDLLNPNDELLIEFLCSGNITFPVVSARIEGMDGIGVLDVETVRIRSEFLNWATGKGVNLLFILVFLTVIFFVVDEKARPMMGGLWLLFAILGLVIVSAYFIQYQKAKNKNRQKV